MYILDEYSDNAAKGSIPTFKLITWKLRRKIATNGMRISTHGEALFFIFICVTTWLLFFYTNQYSNYIFTASMLPS
jgi:hypothetical protein